jgi:hypothetical protein
MNCTWNNLTAREIIYLQSFRFFLERKGNWQMPRLLLLIIVLVSVTAGLKAQTEILDKPFMDDVRFNKIIDGSYLRLNLKISDVQGTPYLNEKYESGKITTTQDTVYENIALRYNAFTDDLEFKQGENVFNVAFKTIVKKAEFGGKTFSCRSFSEHGTTRDGFFKLVTEGKASLLARFTIKFLDREDAKAFSDYQPARFEDVEKTYFISVDSAPAQMIINKKSLPALFGAKKGEMEQYISKNKLSVKDEEALIKITNYYNSL